MSALVRALDLLTLIGESQDAVSLTEISEQSGLPLPTAHRILGSLEELEFVRRDDVSKQYFPGRRLLRLAATVRRSTLSQAAEVHLGELSEQFNETVMLTQLVDKRAVCVALAESRRPLQLSVHVGKAVPLHAAASARTLYADYSVEDVEKLLDGHDFAQLQPGTPSGVPEVLRHLESIRAQGYDICDNEFDENMWAVSAPIHGASGSIVAGVTLVTPRERSMPQELRDALIAATVETAADIEAAIGGVLQDAPRSARLAP